MKTNYKITSIWWISLGIFVCGLFYILFPDIYLYKGKVLNLAEYDELSSIHTITNHGNLLAITNRDYLLAIYLKEVIVGILVLITIVGSVLIIGLGHINNKDKNN
ncbi:MAG: hypothetical protein Q7U47_04455 [Paludibacter sp.]|nr:hypothetical protein [Paludibacter sp.]